MDFSFLSTKWLIIVAVFFVIESVFIVFLVYTEHIKPFVKKYGHEIIEVTMGIIIITYSLIVYIIWHRTNNAPLGYTLLIGGLLFIIVIGLLAEKIDDKKNKKITRQRIEEKDEATIPLRLLNTVCWDVEAELNEKMFSDVVYIEVYDIEDENDSKANKVCQIIVNGVDLKEHSKPRKFSTKSKIEVYYHSVYEDDEEDNIFDEYEDD